MVEFHLRYTLLVALMALFAANPTTAFWSLSKPKEAPQVDVNTQVDKTANDGASDKVAIEDSGLADSPKRTLTEVAETTVEYGTDISFPMHHSKVSTNYPWLPHNVDSAVPTPPEYQGMAIQPLGNKQEFYDNLIQGCVDFYGDKGHRCRDTERERIEMSFRQIPSMVNYTEHGFLKIRAPERVFNLLKEFWDFNKDKAKIESWPAGNTYTNHWEVPTKMVSVEDVALKGGGYVLKQNVWNAARDSISAWTGQELAECSLYGIRIYEEGAVLAPHVDRLPLVSSAIINVDQDVDEPWPLEVIGHDGKAHNVTMLPGDLVLYESHSILHGRQFPLKGRFMANVFIHFEPIGPQGGDNAAGINGLPPYIVEGSPEEENWRRQNPDGWQLMTSKTFTTGTTEAHNAAATGDLPHLINVLENRAEIVNAKDANGWTPIHEAARSGLTEVAKLLIEKGADVNARTNNGGTALWLARHSLKEDHPIISFFESVGAQFAGPDL